MKGGGLCMTQFKMKENPFSENFKSRYLHKCIRFLFMVQKRFNLPNQKYTYHNR